MKKKDLIKGRLNDEDDMLTDIRTPESISDAVNLVRRIAKKFNLDIPIIRDDSEGGVCVSFSKDQVITYDQVAPHIGLQYWNGLKDIKTFELHRSRIPTDVF